MEFADSLALDIDRALFDSELESTTPVSLHDLAGGLEQTSTLLKSRVGTAQGLVLDIELYMLVLRFVSTIVATDPSCVLGPSTSLGSSSPCDPVQSVKVYSLAAGTVHRYLCTAEFQLDASYVLRVEHLKSGRLRVTRTESAAAGPGWGISANASPSPWSATTESGERREQVGHRY